MKRSLARIARVLPLYLLALAAPLQAGLFGLTGTPAPEPAGLRIERRTNFTLGREHVLYDGDEVRGDLVPAADRHPQLFGSPNERLAVVFVHGLHPMFLDGHWSNPLKGNPALPWKGFSTALGARFATGKYPTWNAEFFYWGYRPTRPYPELAREFAQVVEQALPGRRLVLITHSAGALIPRFARGQGLLPNLEAVIGIGAAHGGVQGASFLLARDSIEEEFLAAPERFGEGYVDQTGRPRHRLMDVIRATRAEFLPTSEEDAADKIPFEVMASSAWGNEDGGFTREQIAAHGIPTQQLPPIDYPRFDHLGEYQPSAPPPAAGVETRTLPDGTHELLGSWFDGWRENDSSVTAYEAAPDRLWRYPQESGFLPTDGAEHATFVFNTEVIARVLDQVEGLASGELSAR